MAIMRSAGYCEICAFRDGKLVEFEEVHHVYGRARANGEWWREEYTNMLCVCKACHPLPIQTPGGSNHLGWVEIILEKANKNPLNPDFSTYRD